MPARTIGCENVSGRPGSRISAPARTSAADAASSSSRLASLAACRRSPHSRIATARPGGPRAPEAGRAAARSTCPRSARRSARRVRHTLPLARFPLPRSAPTSSRIRNGVPPVACRHASTNPGSGDAPNPSATNCATAVRVNGARWSTSAEGSIASAASSARPRLPRVAAWPRSRRSTVPPAWCSRNERNRKEGESAHCASSRAMHTGSEELTLAHSQ